MKWDRLVPVMCMSVVLLGSRMTPPALAQTSNTLQDNVPGSLLVFPIFDIIGANETKISITNNGVNLVLVRLTFVCQPLGDSLTSAQFCNASDESFSFTPHQTRVFDVGTELGGVSATCPTGQGYIVAFAERQCDPTGPGCTGQNGSVIAPGETAPTSWNALIGSYQLFYNGSALSQSLHCGGVPCSPPATGLAPDVEGANAMAIQSPQPVLSFLGTDVGPGSALTLTFNTTATSDYVALPRGLNTNFAAVGGLLGSGPPASGPVEGVELQTNFILLNLNTVIESANPFTRVAIQVWNWFEVGFTVSNQFICWERILGTTIDPHFGVALLGSDYGSVRFTPIPSGGVTPALLGAVEQVASGGRTIRPMFHTGSTAATFVTDVEGP